MEAAPILDSPEQVLQPDLLEFYAERVVTIFGVTGSIADLAKICPIDLSDPSISLDVKNEFVAKAANEAGIEVEPEHVEQFNKVIYKHGLERKFTVAEPAKNQSAENNPTTNTRLPERQATDEKPAKVSKKPVAKVIHAVDLPASQNQVEQPLKPLSETVLATTFVYAKRQRKPQNLAERNIAAINSDRQAEVSKPIKPGMRLSKETVSSPSIENPHSAEMHGLKQREAKEQVVYETPADLAKREPLVVVASQETSLSIEKLSIDSKVEEAETTIEFRLNDLNMNLEVPGSVSEILELEANKILEDGVDFDEEMIALLAEQAYELPVNASEGTDEILADSIDFDEEIATLLADQSLELPVGPSTETAVESSYENIVEVAEVDWIAELNKEPLEVYEGFVHSLLELIESAALVELVEKADQVVIAQSEFGELQEQSLPALSIVIGVAERLTVLEDDEKELVSPILKDIVGAIHGLEVLEVTETEPETIAAVEVKLKELCVALFEAIGIEYKEEGIEQFILAIIGSEFRMAKPIEPLEELPDIENMGTHEIKLFARLAGNLKNNESQLRLLLGSSALLYMRVAKPQQQVLV